jgi:hypothetical protein
VGRSKEGARIFLNFILYTPILTRTFIAHQRARSESTPSRNASTKLVCCIPHPHAAYANHSISRNPRTNTPHPSRLLSPHARFCTREMRILVYTQLLESYRRSNWANACVFSLVVRVFSLFCWLYLLFVYLRPCVFRFKKKERE